MSGPGDIIHLDAHREGPKKVQMASLGTAIRRYLGRHWAKADKSVVIGACVEIAVTTAIGTTFEGQLPKYLRDIADRVENYSKGGGSDDDGRRDDGEGPGSDGPGGNDAA